jgi:C1A family cysteine protease
VSPSGDLPVYTATRPSGGVSPASLPIRYDCREYGHVSPVQNQGACGSCYAFASVADVEARLLVNGAGLYDFSENNAKECSYGAPSCGGGNYYEVANLFASSGTVLETCDPYVPNYTSCETGCDPITTLLGFSVISTDAIPNPEVLKTYIYTYGPVYTTLYAGDGDAWETEMGFYDGSYTLYNAASPTTNHAILLVGWDDTLSHAGGQGAWIFKNSWSTGWGGTCGYGAEGGYGTIAYGSASIGEWSSFMSDWQMHDSDGTLYYYNEAGWSAQLGYGITTAWAMARFDATADVDLERVEFWTTDGTTDIDIYIYDNYNGSALSNLLASKLNSSFTDPGYHSVELDAPLALTNGDDFYIAVKFTNDSYTYPLAYDNAGTIETGKTYYSFNGSNSTWVDAGLGGCDMTIRARTTASAGGCSITVTAPTSGAELNPDSSETITWNSSGASANVKLDLFKGAAHQCEIEASTANDGSYSWTVDDCSGGDDTDYRIRVADAADTTCRAFSDYFQIVTPCEIVVSAPSSGAEWALDTTYNIEWSSSGAAATVDILLYKGGALQCAIANATGNDGTHPWTVDDCGGGEDTDYRIRVVDGSCFDYSDYFSIVSLCSLEVTNPAAGADLPADSSVTIEWTSIAAGSQVNIFLFKGAALQCTVVVATADDGSYNWTVDECGGDNGANYRLKIVNSADSDCYDFSGYFMITIPCDIQATVPASGADWQVGDSETIVWSASGAGPNVRLELYQGSTRICDIDTLAANDGSYQWTVSECGNGSAADYRVKVVSRADTICFDFTDMFSITIPCELELTNPTSGEVCYLDSNLTIEWNAQEADSLVCLMLFKGNDSLCCIDSVATDSGNCVWTVSDCGGGSAAVYRIRIVDLANPDCFDFGDYFAITYPCSIEVTSPTAAVEWVVGDTQTVTWNSGGVGANVRIDLFKGDVLICQFEPGTPNDGVYEWPVNDCGAGTGSDYQLRIADLDNPLCFEFSDYFTIIELALAADDDELELPDQFQLGQNYPNPFNPATRIDIVLPQGGPVQLTVYNLIGQPVQVLQDGYLSRGEHSFSWNAHDESGEAVPTGIYFYRLVASDFSATRKMMLLK